MRRNTIARGSGATAMIALLIVAVWKLPFRHWAEAFILWIRGFGLPGAFIYGIVYSLGAVLFIPGSALTAGAGLVYGTVMGVLIVSPASVAGATGAFLIARYFARDWVEQKLAGHPRFSAIDRAVEKQGFKVILLLRLQPVLPFVLLNYALGLTRVRLWDYVLASWIGMLPATIVYVYLGSALHSVSELFSEGMAKHNAIRLAVFWAGLAAGAALLWVLTRMARKALQQELNAPEASGSAA